MKFIPVIILSILLTGCAIFEKPIEPIIIQAQVVNIDSGALEPCALLKENLVINTFDDIITIYAETATSYAVCAEKQANSIKLLKQFGNIK